MECKLYVTVLNIKLCKNITLHLLCTAYTRPWAVALNKIAIEAIRPDPSFKWKL